MKSKKSRKTLSKTTYAGTESRTKNRAASAKGYKFGQEGKLCRRKSTKVYKSFNVKKRRRRKVCGGI